MGARDSSDMYALSPWASGIHIRQIPRAHVTTITCTTLVASQNIHTIPTGIHCKQLWNIIIIAEIVNIASKVLHGKTLPYRLSHFRS